MTTLEERMEERRQQEWRLRKLEKLKIPAIATIIGLALLCIVLTWNSIYQYRQAEKERTVTCNNLNLRFRNIIDDGDFYKLKSEYFKHGKTVITEINEPFIHPKLLEENLRLIGSGKTVDELALNLYTQRVIKLNTLITFSQQWGTIKKDGEESDLIKNTRLEALRLKEWITGYRFGLTTDDLIKMYNNEPEVNQLE